MRAYFAFFALFLAVVPARAFTQADTHTPLSADVRIGQFVALHGRIVPGSVGVVKAALGRAGPGHHPVLIDSPGGSITPALAIGRLIRARGLPVAVARVDKGSPTSADGQCASACVLVLAAGVGRSVGAGAKVGVHRLVDWTTYSRTWDVYRVLRRRGIIVRRELLSRKVLSSHEVYTDAPPRAYAAVRSYLAEMGEAPGLIALMEGTPAARLHWMTREELKATRLITGRDGVGTSMKG